MKFYITITKHGFKTPQTCLKHKIPSQDLNENPDKTLIISALITAFTTKESMSFKSETSYLSQKIYLFQKKKDIFIFLFSTA